jgi:hypothetical protein
MWLAIAGLGHGDHRRARWYVILATLSSESLISNVLSAFRQDIGIEAAQGHAQKLRSSVRY